MLGYKGAKWVTRVEFRAERDLGYWERYGAPVDSWLEDEQPCNVNRLGGCPSCWLEALQDQRKRWGATEIPSPAKMSLPAGTTKAGQDCSTQP